MKYVTTRQMRGIDRAAIDKFGIPAIVLMENAGRAVAEEVLKLKPRRVVLVCGSGNNGGDGFVAARHLANRGVRCKVVHFQGPARMKPEPRVNFSILRRMKIPCLRYGRAALRKRLRQADVIVDALFGTGLSRAVGEPYKTAIEEMNSSGASVVSVDIPSGLNADTGRPTGVCVRAARTVTLAYPKAGFARKASRPFTGRVVVADISIPR